MIEKINILEALDKAGLYLSKSFTQKARQSGIQSRTGRLYSSFKNYKITELNNTVSLEFNLPFYANYLDQGTKFIRARNFLSPFYTNQQYIENLIAAKTIEDINTNLDKIFKNKNININIG